MPEDIYISASVEEWERDYGPSEDETVEEGDRFASASNEEVAEYYGIEGVETKAPPQAPYGGIPEEEREFAAAWPNTYAAGKVAWNFLTSMESVMKVASPQSPEEWVEQGQNIGALSNAITRELPYVKYLYADKREEFLSLSKWEQTEALLWNLFETELLLFPSQMIRGFLKGIALPFKGAKKGYRAIRPGFKFEPIEDLANKIRPFYAEEHMFRGLKRAGFANDEILAVMDEGPRGLRQFFFTKMAAKGDVSPALRKAISFKKGARLSKETKALLDTKKLRETYYRKEWNKVVGKHLGKEFNPKYAERIFDAQVRTTLGEQWVGRVTLKGANDYYMANFLRHTMTHSKALDRAVKAGGYNKWMFDAVSPVRVVLGNWEKRFKTFTRVYQVVIPGLEKSNKYVFDRQTVLAQMYKERGLGAWKISGRGNLKFKPSFSETEADQAYKAMIEVNDLRSLQRRVPIKVEELERRIKGIVKGLPENSRKIIKTQEDNFNSLWSEHVRIKIPQIFEAAGLTARGQREVGGIERGLYPFLDELFSTASKANYPQRALAVKGMLRELRKPLVAVEGKHPWFRAQGEELKKVLSSLEKEFTSTREGGNFISYNENYVPRIAQTRDAMFTRIDNELVGKMRSFYGKERKNPFAFDLVRDLESSSSGRIRAQGNELFLYPAVKKAVDHAVKLPLKQKKYIDHWIARATGRHSFMDEQVASFMRKVIPFGKKAWTEERIGHLARRANDLAILGGLGFKPFSAMRNMFQPLLTIPAEMGGIQGFEHLLHGYKKALDPAFRQWVRDNGMIQEYAPEIYFKERLLPWGAQAKWDQVRDVGLWMFSGVDRSSRYTSAGAAVHRWERALEQVGVTRPGVWNHAKFMKKSGAQSHYPWVKDQINDLVRVGKLEEGKIIHAKDVVANTQFLYRPAESAIISQAGGVVGKTGFLFQSWWANYGTLLEKWMRVGDAGEKANKAFTWMLSHAIGYTLMETLWGPKTAERSVFLGPFPTTVDKFMVPASWGPIYHTLNLIKTGLSPEVWAGDSKRLVTQAKALLRSIPVMVPAGLMVDTMARAAAREGVEGLPASIIRYQRARTQEPVAVRLGTKVMEAFE